MGKVGETLDCVKWTAGYDAGPGYDLATGLGSIDLNLLATTWNTGSATTVTAVKATPSSCNVRAASVQLSATVTGSGGSPTGTMAFTLDGVTALDTAANTAAKLSGELLLELAAVGSNGNATISEPASLLSLGNGTIRALYSGDGVFEGSAGSHHAITAQLS